MSAGLVAGCDIAPAGEHFAARSVAGRLEEHRGGCGRIAPFSVDPHPFLRHREQLRVVAGRLSQPRDRERPFFFGFAGHGDLKRLRFGCALAGGERHRAPARGFAFAACAAAVKRDGPRARGQLGEQPGV